MTQCYLKAGRTCWDNPTMDVVRSVIEQIKRKGVTLDGTGFEITLIIDGKENVFSVFNYAITKSLHLGGLFDYDPLSLTEWSVVELKAEGKDWTEVENLIEAFLSHDLRTVKRKFELNPDGAPSSEQLSR